MPVVGPLHPWAPGCGRGGNGRRTALKMRRRPWRAGSIPAGRTRSVGMAHSVGHATVEAKRQGAVGERLSSGLQLRACRFESGWRLQIIRS